MGTALSLGASAGSRVCHELCALGAMCHGGHVGHEPCALGAIWVMSREYHESCSLSHVGEMSQGHPGLSFSSVDIPSPEALSAPLSEALPW